MNFKLAQDNNQIMGILNITPDSFYDGGVYESHNSIVKRVKEMITQGVDIIDIGAESSRPGSKRVSADEEIQRLEPVVSMIRKFTDIPISIDSTKFEVIEKLIPFNIQMINDISGGKDKAIISLASKHNLYICIMHMQNNPENMQNNPKYQDVTKEIYLFLKNRIDLCLKEGVKQDKIIIDPGFGFGKSLDHNYTILNNLNIFKKLSNNILVGISRKSMIGNLLEKDIEHRLDGSLSAAAISIINGATIVRTHDVLETKIICGILEKILHD